MTELNDHLKLLFARAAQLLLPRLRRSRCGTTRPRAIYADLLRARAARATRGCVITFPVARAGRHFAEQRGRSGCSRARATPACSRRVDGDAVLDVVAGPLPAAPTPSARA